jgi:hypothetical protein
MGECTYTYHSRALFALLILKSLSLSLFFTSLYSLAWPHSCALPCVVAQLLPGLACRPHPSGAWCKCASTVCLRMPGLMYPRCRLWSPCAPCPVCAVSWVSSMCCSAPDCRAWIWRCWCAVCCVLWAVCCGLCAVCCVLCAVCCVLCVLCNAMRCVSFAMCAV